MGLCSIILKSLKQTAIGTALIGAVVGTSGYLYYNDLIKKPDTNIRRENIEHIIRRSTEITFSDGKHILGSLGKGNGYQIRYQTLDEIDKFLVDAFIAAEDQNFAATPGCIFDIPSKLRAAYNTLTTGHLQGGSGIVEQFAKFLNKRIGHGPNVWRKKIDEEKLALKLCAYYTSHNDRKRLLEYYLNTVPVGETHGIYAATRIYFNKDSTKELDELQQAFIAASVNKPTIMFPFRHGKESEEHYKKRMIAAYQRVEYVLSRMNKSGYISKEEFKKLKRQLQTKGISFDRGSLHRSVPSEMRLVREELGKPDVRSALEKICEDPKKPTQCGLRIVTTFDYGIDSYVKYVINQQLTDINIERFGYHKPSHAKIDRTHITQRGEFTNAKIVGINLEEEHPHIVVDTGTVRGVFDHEALERFTLSYERYRQGWFIREVTLKQIRKAVRHKFHVGDRVYVSRRYDENDGRKDYDAIFDIEQRAPKRDKEVKGAAVILNPEGAVEALYGNRRDNDSFNYATDGSAISGSIAKLILYYEALQFGWDIINDKLVNTRTTFVNGPTEKDVYSPKNSHPVFDREVPMIIAGMKSENIASVWLLYHIFDHIAPYTKTIIRTLKEGKRNNENPQRLYKRLENLVRNYEGAVNWVLPIISPGDMTAEEYYKLIPEDDDLTRSVKDAELMRIASKVGMSLLKGESEREYYERMRDDYGIRWNENYFRIAAYNIIAEKEKTSKLLGYGFGSERVMEEIEERILRLEKKYYASSNRARKQRIKHTIYALDQQMEILNQGFSVMHRKRESVRNELKDLRSALRDNNLDRVRNITEGRYYVTYERNGEPEDIPAIVIKTLEYKKSLPKTFIPLAEAIAKDGDKILSALSDNSRIWIDNQDNIEELDELEAKVEDEIKRIKKDKFSAASIRKHPLFKMEVAKMHYLKILNQLSGISAEELSRRHGGFENIGPAALVLGVELTPMEAAMTYQSMTSGRRCEPYAIDRIERIATGEVLYTTNPKCEYLNMPLRTRKDIMQILSAVNMHGTGREMGGLKIKRWSDKEITYETPSTRIYSSDGDWAVYETGGKTGSTQDYKDGWFVTVVPQMKNGKPSLDDITTSSVWFGGDGPMYIGRVRKRQRNDNRRGLYGSQTALQASVRIVSSYIGKMEQKSKADLDKLLADGSPTIISPFNGEQQRTIIDMTGNVSKCAYSSSATLDSTITPTFCRTVESSGEGNKKTTTREIQIIY